MKVPSFEQLAPAYAKLWAELEPLPSAQGEIAGACKRAMAAKPVYQNVSSRVWGKPDYWYIVALINERESGGSLHAHLFNGDSLAYRTIHEPAGQPIEGQCAGPPFTFEDSAYWALRKDGLNTITDWNPSSVGYYMERYNGWGYLNKNGEDPYLVGGSNKQTLGKYTSDGHYDSSVMDTQLGVLTMLKGLVQVDPSINLGEAPSVQPKKGETVSVPSEFNTIISEIESIDWKKLNDEVNLALKFAPIVETFIPSSKPVFEFIARIQPVLAKLQ